MLIARAQWRIQLFGPLVVETPTGKQISLAGRKAGELLAWLAMHPEQAYSREQLISLLWDDADVSNARTRLRQEILNLRTRFASDSDPSPLLRITRNELRMNPESRIDAIRFLAVCSQARQAKDWESQRTLVVEVCDLYRADLLAEYDSLWIVAERARFSRVYEQLLCDYAESCRQHGNYVESEEALQRLIAHSPMLEEGHVALMRLYAEQGQPTRVHKQYQALEQALRESSGIPPTAGTRRLAEQLRAEAGQRATAVPRPAACDYHNGNHPPLVSGPTTEREQPITSLSEPPSVLQTPPFVAPNATSNAQRPGIPKQFGAQDALLSHTDPPAAPGAIRLRFVPLLPAGLVILALVVGVSLRRVSQSSRKEVVAPTLMRRQERHVYFYTPQPGEKPNAEGKAVFADDSGIYVTGIIDTVREDTDILTIRLSTAGQQIWARRYSSPEHDCDRAFSISRDQQDRLFVGGETYVPDRKGHPGGWHLTLLCYVGGSGQKLWDRRSKLPMKNEGGNVQVCSDMQGGCYLGGTALVNGKQTILLSRYDSAGRILWERTIPAGQHTTFSRLGIASDGRLYVCGAARLGQGSKGVNDAWIIACLNPHGSVLWKNVEVSDPEHGRNSAGRLALARADDLYVAGIVDTGDAAHGGQGTALAIEKLASDGTRLWRRIVPHSGPAVVLDGLAIDVMGNIALGGTEYQPDSNQGIMLAHYDAFGNLVKTWRYPLPSGYHSANLHALALDGEGNIRFLGQISPGNIGAMNEKSSVILGACALDGHARPSSLFDAGPDQPNVGEDLTCASQNRLVVTGQAGLPGGQRTLSVLFY
jgi:DNA-binding SARP family transcriptional activator